MFNLNLNFLEITDFYESFLKENINLTQSEKEIARALLISESAEKTAFLTEKSVVDIKRVYYLIKNFISNEDDIIKENDIATEENKETKKQINRGKAIKYVIRNLEKYNPDFKFISRSYNIINGELHGKPINIKIKLSANYSDNNIGSWHKEDPNKIANFDFHIYVTNDNTRDNYDYRTLIFNTAELNDLLEKKEYKENFINYYFNWKDGRVYDDRESTADNSKPIYVDFADADTQKKWILK